MKVQGQRGRWLSSPLDFQSWSMWTRAFWLYVVFVLIVYFILFCLWKAKAEKKSSIEVKCNQLHLHTHHNLFVLFWGTNWLRIWGVYLWFHWDSILWKGSWWVVFVFVSCLFHVWDFAWALVWCQSAQILLWKGVILAYLTYTMSVSWPMLKGFSTRVRGLLSRFVMSDSAEALSMPKRPEPDMASGTMEGTPGSLGTEVPPASPVRAEGEKGDHKGKRTWTQFQRSSPRNRVRRDAKNRS